MRFARVVSAYDCYNPRINHFAETAELDVLQLDYAWPNTLEHGDRSRQSFALGFVEQLGTLHRTLYLDPRLHLISNAGGGDTLGGVEALAEYLCAHDDQTLPITAIRGDNLLPRLEELFADGIELRDIAGGARLQDLTRPLLAAHVELGGGPIKTALDEGSRIVVAGCYDVAAPVIASAISTTSLTWDHPDRLAQLAHAVQRQAAIIEVSENGQIELDRQQGDPWSIAGSLAPGPDSKIDDELVRHADVCYRVTHEAPAQPPNARSEPPCISDEKAMENWLLRVDYLASYVAEFQLEVDESCASDPVEQIRSHFDSKLDGQQMSASLETDIMRPTADATVGSDSNSVRRCLVRIRCLSSEIKPCDAFVRAAKNFVAQNRWCRAVSVDTFPAVRGQVASFYCEVPREAIAVSVDTRPAKEWR